MLSLSRKNLLVSAIAAVISGQALADAGAIIHLEDITDPQSYRYVRQLTGSSNYGITLRDSYHLSVDASLGVLPSQLTALTVDTLMDGGEVTVNSVISGQNALQVSGSGNGSVLLLGELHATAPDGYALRGDMQDLVFVMGSGSRVAGDIDGVDMMLITAGENELATITSSRIGAGFINVHGPLLLQQQGTEFSGDFNLMSDGTLRLQVNDSTNPAQALVNVRGTATLAMGSAIELASASSRFLKQETQYTLIRADELVDQGVTIRSLSNLLAVKAFDVVDNESLVATIALSGSGLDADQELAELDERLRAQGVSLNGRQAANRFVSGVLANLDNQNSLYQRYLNADDAQLTQLIEELVPEINGATLQAALSASGLTGSALQARVAALGANSGDLLSETGAWLRVLDGDTKQGRRAGVAGYDADSRGLVIGVDGKLNEATTLGLALSHVRTDVQSKLGHDTEVNSYLMSAYGRWEQGQFGLTGSMSYGLAENDSTRRVAGERIRGAYDSHVLSAALEAGYRLDFETFSVEPLLAARYAQVAIDSYREKGSAAALKVNDQRLEVFDLGAGLAATATWGEFTPSARLMAYHDFAQDKVQTTSSFVLGGTSFISSAAAATSWTYEAGLGLDWSRGQYTLGVAYDYTRKADFNADTFSLKARYDF